MAQYFFVLHECGLVTDDQEGQELPDLAAARAKAVHEARAIMCEEVKHGRLCLSCCMVVEDADHNEVARVPFKEALTISGS